MEIVKWTRSGGGQMVRLSELEALKIIRSLTNQLITKDCNVERLELHDQNGKYFSLSVHPDPSIPDAPESLDSVGWLNLKEE
jgi:hypothetical protein